MKHTKTDPACYKHKAPRSPLAHWWFDLNRGNACKRCHPYRPEHTREVIAVHEGYGEEAICGHCLKYWPCETVRKGKA